MKRFARETVQPRAGSACSTSVASRQRSCATCPTSTICGFDHRAAYIERARREFGERGRFFRDDIGAIGAHGVGPFPHALCQMVRRKE
jgi:hypothetical protein